VREYDDVRREAVAADVAALPGPIGIGGGEGGGDWSASYGAARVVTAVRADEVHRLGADGSWVLSGEYVQEVLVVGQFTPADRFPAWTAVDQSPTPDAQSINATVPPDEDRPITKLPTCPRHLLADGKGGEGLARPCGVGLDE